MKKLARNLTFSLVILILAVAALGCMTFALYACLQASLHSPSLAAFYCGLVLILCALIIWLVFLILQQQEKKQSKSQDVQLMLTKLVSLISEHPTKAALIACMVGAAAGTSGQWQEKLATLLNCHCGKNCHCGACCDEGAQSSTQSLLEVLAVFLLRK